MQIATVFFLAHASFVSALRQFRGEGICRIAKLRAEGSPLKKGTALRRVGFIAALLPICAVFSDSALFLVRKAKSIMQQF